MIKIITVFLDSSGNYLAKFSNDPDVIEAFGTDVLPTPFRRPTPPETVTARLRLANPGHHIEYQEDARA